tara:strand:- start:662 stop:2170 length:1509 start_codon:yes stop_codon:yes gene_type:complete
MSIRRYVASADTTITNAYEANLVTRATGSNMGASDVSEAFTIYAQASTASAKSSELSRVITKFSITDISTDRTNGTIPVSGSVGFYLRLYNAAHSQTLPKDFSLNISAISTDWEEGTGLDMEGYTDLTHDSVGANWTNASAGSPWTTAGGDYYHDASSSFSASFSTGTENLEVDITTLVEQWLGSPGNVLGTKTNYGVGVMFPAAQEGASRSYYTKRFFARGTEFWFKRPIIEARWDSSIKDRTGDFFISSSLATAAENLNTIYLYNNIRGQLRNIPIVAGGKILVSVYSGSSDNTAPSGSKYTLPIGGGVVTNNHTNVTGGHVSTGIYSASFAYTGSATTIYPVWHNVSLGSEVSAEFSTGSAITVNTFNSTDYSPSPNYVTTITNLKRTYSQDEEPRFRLYVRQKDWNPSIYSKAKSDPENLIIEDVYYRIIRTIDDLGVVKYGTGSYNHTRLSFDVSGNYFDLPISILEKDYMYGIKFLYKLPNGLYREQPHIFKFRVE